jgi:hypothetical protein
MNNSLKVIDNFLDTDSFNKLTSVVLGEKFPWFFAEQVSLDPKDAHMITDPLAVETWGFHHVVFERAWSIKSFSYEFFEPFFQQIYHELGYNQEHLIRARLSAKFQKQGFTCDNYNLPHIDYFYPHASLIYYLNDSDGDTRVFDQHYEYNSATIADMPLEFTTQTRITPKANRLVIIDGLQYHTASNPVSANRRVIFNINFRPL